MAERKKTSKVGSTVEVPEGAEVARPDGSRHAVTGGSYVLDVPGEFLVAGEEVKVA